MDGAINGERDDAGEDRKGKRDSHVGGSDEQQILYVSKLLRSDDVEPVEVRDLPG